MALEGFLGIHFLLSEWDPMVSALYSLYVVIEQCIGKAVALKLQVGLPSIIRIQELVSVVEPSGFYRVANCDVNRAFLYIVVCNPTTTW